MRPSQGQYLPHILCGLHLSKYQDKNLKHFLSFSDANNHHQMEGINCLMITSK